uniref:Maturase K n=1 Tax=Panagrolaimus superbus TaxID=310955 RepID=A0A914Y9T8_9BILA
MEKCNLRSLDIWNQSLTYDEYSFLTSSGDLKRLYLNEYIICHPNGTLVTFDQLFKNIPKLIAFFMVFAENYSSMFESDTFKKLTDILPHLKELDLYGLTERI